MLDLLIGAGLRRLGRVSVLDTALVAQIATFLSLFLALGRLAMLVNFFLNEARGFFGFAFDAHQHLHTRLPHQRMTMLKRFTTELAPLF